MSWLESPTRDCHLDFFRLLFSYSFVPLFPFIFLIALPVTHTGAHGPSFKRASTHVACALLHTHFSRFDISTDSVGRFELVHCRIHHFSFPKVFSASLALAVVVPLLSLISRKRPPMKLSDATRGGSIDVRTRDKDGSIGVLKRAKAGIRLFVKKAEHTTARKPILDSIAYYSYLRTGHLSKRVSFL